MFITVPHMPVSAGEVMDVIMIVGIDTWCIFDAHHQEEMWVNPSAMVCSLANFVLIVLDTMSYSITKDIVL